MGRCSNVIGLRLGKFVPWKMFTAPFIYGQTSSELLFIEQVEEFFKKRSVISLAYIFCGVRLINSIEGRLIAEVSLYDSEDHCNIKENYLQKKDFEGSLNFFKEISAISKGFDYGEFRQVLNRISYTNIRLLYIQRGLLLIGKRIFSKRLTVHIKMLDNASITATLLTTYVCARLKQHYQMSGLLKSVEDILYDVDGLQGYRVSYAGRFNRNPRGQRAVLKGGSLPFSKIKNSLDYSEKFVILKFGKCGIKIWLNKSSDFKEYSVILNLL